MLLIVFAGGPPSSILKYATVEIFNNTYCNEIFDSANITTRNVPKGIISTQICAGDKNGKKDACEVSNSVSNNYSNELSNNLFLFLLGIRVTLAGH